MGEQNVRPHEVKIVRQVNSGKELKVFCKRDFPGKIMSSVPGAGAAIHGVVALIGVALVSGCAGIAGNPEKGGCNDQRIAGHVKSWGPVSRHAFSRELEGCSEADKEELPLTIIAATHARTDSYLKKLIEEGVKLNLDPEGYVSRPLMEAIEILDSKKN